MIDYFSYYWGLSLGSMVGLMIGLSIGYYIAHKTSLRRLDEVLNNIRNTKLESKNAK